jgi:hypothetical protein
VKSYSVSQQAALAAAHRAEVLFIEVDFSSGVQRYCTAAVPMTWGGYTWTGGVNPTSIEPIRETEQAEAVGHKIKLSGVPSSQRAIVLAEHIQGRRITFWRADLDVTAYTIIGTPVKEAESLLDTATLIDEDDGTLTIEVELESKMARFLRANVLRYTAADHQQLYPSDTICRFTPQTGRTVVWPSAAFFR